MSELPLCGKSMQRQCLSDDRSTKASVIASVYMPLARRGGPGVVSARAEIISTHKDTRIIPSLARSE